MPSAFAIGIVQNVLRFRATRLEKEISAPIFGSSRSGLAIRVVGRIKRETPSKKRIYYEKAIGYFHNS